MSKENETMLALYEVLDIMKKEATVRIGWFKRGKCNGYTLNSTMKREIEFRANCMDFKKRIKNGIDITRKDLGWLKKDQHDRSTMRLNLNDCLGKDHPEIDNIIDLTFGKAPKAKIVMFA